MTSIYIILIFFSIVFGQSGLDKAFNFKGELTFLTSHFEKTILRNVVPQMLFVIMLLEIVTALISLIAIIEISWVHHFGFAKIAGLLATSSLLCLLFGQRIAKDYAGAMTIVVYLIPALLFWVVIEGF